MKQDIQDIEIRQDSFNCVRASFYRGDAGGTLRFRIPNVRIDEDCHAVLIVIRADKTAFSSQLTVQDGVLLYKVTPEATAVVGDMFGQIKLYDENGGVRTFPKFKMCVYPTLADPEKVVPKESVNALTALIAKTLALYKRLKEGLENGSFLGPQGPKGEKGDTGEKGDRGEKGETGNDGTPGMDGKDGNDGAPGADGQDGKDGITPTIGDNGNWYLGDTDTGRPSRGDTGATGQTGPKGDTGDVGPAGPQGPKGDKGDTGTPGADGTPSKDGIDGKDGLSPTVAVSDIPGGHRITITDADGDKTVDVMDGAPGADGVPGRDGADGHTPIYGTDYGTPEQIAEIAQQAAGVLELELDKKADRYAIKTVMDSVATTHTQYFLGRQTAVDIVLPDTADAGQIISVSWYNGDTAATLSITGTMLDFDYTPSANTRSEINALWDGTYWSVLGNEMEVPIDA